MATKTYRIEINGVSQAISEFDELIAKAGQLERTLSSGVSVEIKGDTTQLAQAQAEVTKQVERQNEALREQTSIIQSQAGEYKEALTVATSILGTYDDNLKKLAEYDAELKKIAAAKKEAERAGASTDEMATLLQMEMKYKALKSDTLGVIRTETKLIEAENGSYDQMAATVSRLRDALRASSGNLSSGEFSTISAAVDDLDRKLKDADKGMGQFFRNVGNYPSAAEGFSKIKVEVAGIEREFDGLKPAIMELKNAMGQLAVQGKTDTDDYRALASQMRDLQLAMATVNDEMARSKDASSGMHDMIEMVQGFAAIGEVGQGFAQLFGFDDGALGEQIQKMTTLMGILQGLNELKNQLATGTGIGPTLKKLFDVSGLGDSMKNLSTYAKELASRLHLVKPSADAAAAGMTTFGVAARFAAESVKMFWRALLVGLVIEGVMLVIDGLVEGIKWLYNVTHDWLSLSDDVERSNEAMADSYDTLKKSVDGFSAARQREYDEGLIDAYQKQADNLANINTQLEKEINLLKTSVQLGSKNAGITPATADWEKLGKVFDNIQTSMASGNKWVSGWNDVVKEALADVTYRLEQLDATDEKALKNFIQWVNESPQVGQAIAWALKYGDDEMKSLATSIQDGTSNMYELANAAIQAQNAMRGINKSLTEELELRRKYGKNWQTEQRVKQSNEEVDSSGLTDEQKADLKARREAEIRETTQHGKKLNTVRKRTANDALNIERQMQQDKLALMRDGLTKTLETIEYERRRRLEEIGKMGMSEEKKAEARNLANQRYDKEAAEARKKWREDYLKGEKEFQQNLVKQQRELSKQETEYAKGDTAFSRAKTMSGFEKKYAEQLLEPFYKELRSIGQLEEGLRKKTAELAEEMSELLDKSGKLRSQIANTPGGPEADALTKEYEMVQRQIEARTELVSLALSKMAEVQQLSQSMEKAIESDQSKMVAESTSERFKKWVEYYNDLFDFKVAWGKKDIEYEKKFNEIELDNQIDALANELEAQRNALSGRYEALLNDDKAIEESGRTREQINKEYDEKLLDLETVYRTRESELILSNLQKNEELERQYEEDVKKGRSDMYSSIINELNKFYSALDSRQSRMKSDNTDAWGFFNIKKFRKQRDEVIREFEDILMPAVSFRMEKLREELAAGSISLGDFTNAYSELEQLKEKAQDTINEIKGDNGLEDFVKGVDEWVQQIGQAANQILSAVFDYRNSEFDRLKDDLDKRIELAQEKYDEMEELAQKHKDAMNEIEDELTTARGDRRQHLIDALNDEIDAQRRALAEQQKAERQKQKLEKESDKLELERKKEQKRQNLITAIINAALAISQAAANKWPVPAIPLMALAAAAGAAQVAAISAQHYAEGGLLHGPTHAQGGIKVGGGIEVEGGEYVTNRKTTAKNLALLEYINSRKRAITEEDMMAFFKGGQSKPLLGVKGKFEDGGLLPSLDIAQRTAEVIVERDTRPVVVSVVDIVNAENNLRRVQTLAGLNSDR